MRRFFRNSRMVEQSETKDTDFQVGTIPASTARKLDVAIKLYIASRWQDRRMVITKDAVFFALIGQDHVRDWIPLNEVKEVSPLNDNKLDHVIEVESERPNRPSRSSSVMARNLSSQVAAFQIQTVDDGFNSGRTYHIQADSKDLSDQFMHLLIHCSARARAFARQASKFERSQQMMKKIYNSPVFQFLATGLIIANFALNIYAAQTIHTTLSSTPAPAAAPSNASTPLANRSGAGSFKERLVDGLDTALVLLFAAELAVNLYAHWLQPFLRNPWSVADLAIVVLALIGLAPVGVPLELLLLLRCTRVLRLFGKLKSVAAVFAAVFRSALPMFSTFLIVLTLASIYAIVGVNFFREEAPEHFDTFARAFVSMFRITTGSVDWFFAAFPPVERNGTVSWSSSSFLITYVILISWFFFQVSLAVMVDNLMSANRDAQRARRAEEVRERLRTQRLHTPMDPLLSRLAKDYTDEADLMRRIRALFKVLDSDGLGYMDSEKFQAAVKKLDFTPRINVSDSDFIGMTERLFLEDGRMHEEDFVALVREQLRAYTLGRLSSQSAFWTEREEDFTLLGTLKQVLMDHSSLRAAQARMARFLGVGGRRGSISCLPPDATRGPAPPPTGRRRSVVGTDGASPAGALAAASGAGAGRGGIVVGSVPPRDDVGDVGVRPRGGGGRRASDGGGGGGRRASDGGGGGGNVGGSGGGGGNVGGGGSVGSHRITDLSAVVARVEVELRALFESVLACHASVGPTPPPAEAAAARKIRKRAAPRGKPAVRLSRTLSGGCGSVKPAARVRGAGSSAPAGGSRFSAESLIATNTALAAPAELPDGVAAIQDGSSQHGPKPGGRRRSIAGAPPARGEVQSAWAGGVATPSGVGGVDDEPMPAWPPAVASSPAAATAASTSPAADAKAGPALNPDLAANTSTRAYRRFAAHRASRAARAAQAADDSGGVSTPDHAPSPPATPAKRAEAAASAAGRARRAPGLSNAGDSAVAGVVGGGRLAESGGGALSSAHDSGRHGRGAAGTLGAADGHSPRPSPPPPRRQSPAGPTGSGGGMPSTRSGSPAAAVRPRARRASGSLAAPAPPRRSPKHNVSGGGGGESGGPNPAAEPLLSPLQPSSSAPSEAAVAWEAEAAAWSARGADPRTLLTLDSFRAAITVRRVGGSASTSGESGDGGRGQGSMDRGRIMSDLVRVGPGYGAFVGAAGGNGGGSSNGHSG